MIRNVRLMTSLDIDQYRSIALRGLAILSDLTAHALDIEHRSQLITAARKQDTT